MSETQSADDIRPGEISVALPDRFDAGIYFIGRIRTPWSRREDCPKKGRESTAVCTVEVDPRYVEALSGVENCPHLLLLYWMHEARRDLVRQAPHHHNGTLGTFALRSPVRPNPIAASTVRLVKRDGTQLLVTGLDCLDGTPLVDIKPTDAMPETTVGRHGMRSRTP